MTPKITDEMRQALAQDPGRPLRVEDEQAQRIYLLVSQDGFRQWVDEELRRELQIGFDQVDAGDVADWDIDEILAEAHRRHAAKTSAPHANRS